MTNNARDETRSAGVALGAPKECAPRSLLDPTL